MKCRVYYKNNNGMAIMIIRDRMRKYVNDKKICDVTFDAGVWALWCDELKKNNMTRRERQTKQGQLNLF